MTFFLSKALWYVAAPSNFLVLMLAAGVALGCSRWRRLGRWLVAGAALLFLLIGFLPIANWVGAPLENRFPPPVPPESVTGIIIPGGYVDPWISAARHTAALTCAAERLVETAILARRYPKAAVLVTGGTPIMLSDVFAQPPVSEGEITKNLLVALGVNPDRILLETHSRNTYENALFSEELVHPNPAQTWILVASAADMPRAVGVFRSVGWHVLPWPTNYRTTATALTFQGFNVSGHLHELDAFMHEWIGLAAYRLMGRTRALFPAPRG